MNKNYLVTVLLVIVVLVMGGYALFAMTDIEGTIKNLTVSKPTLEDVKTYFPSEKVIELGELESSYSEEKQYGFIVENQGVQELLVLPKSFNNQDINKRTYLKITKGEYIPEDQTDIARLQIAEKFNSEKEEVSVLYRHKLVDVIEGKAEEKISNYYKVDFYKNSKEVWFYSDDDNVIKYKGDKEEIYTF